MLLVGYNFVVSGAAKAPSIAPAPNRKLLKRNGERGRNRTFNLLIFDQQATNQWFQRFPKYFYDHKQADLGEVVP